MSQGGIPQSCNGTGRRTLPKEAEPFKFKAGAEWRGNAGGRPKAILTDALRRELERDPEKAARIALALLAKALKGDVKAFDAAANRLEGKPIETVRMDGEVNLDPGERIAELLARAAERARKAP